MTTTRITITSKRGGSDDDGVIWTSWSTLRFGLSRCGGIIGLVRQEVLSGIKTNAQFESLRDSLRAFIDESVDTDDYETAAQAYNICQSKGIAASAVDMLICAVAQRRDMSIFTTDPDFEKYAQVLPLKLHVVSGEHRV